VIEEALNELPFSPKEVTTPTGATFRGTAFAQGICAVSIMRAGESMENAVRAVCRGCRIGKILIQRNEESFQPEDYFVKLPRSIADRFVLLMDPMLATGGSATRAIEILLHRGVSESKIIFVAMVAAPEGIRKLVLQFPKMKIVAAAIDENLNDRMYIIPGIGDFGDRYFGTDDR